MLIIGVALSLQAQKFTRGIGVCPGNPTEDFSPALVVDKTTYRNLALRRAAYHSTSHDYNLAASVAPSARK